MLIGLAVGAGVAVVAVLVPWLPEQASTQREGIDLVFWLTTAISAAIFSLVAAVLIYAAFRFRRRPDDEEDGPPIHGHTGLEVAWTVVPLLLVLAIILSSSVVLAQNERVENDPLRVKVTATQFTWRFDYRNGLTSPILRLPIGRSVELSITSRDVIHSLWVPQFGQKKDAVPGIATRLVITPTKLGEYPLVCAELCGLGHSLMRTKAVVVPEDVFAAWLAGRTAPPGEAGSAVFESQGCAGCHAFTPAGAPGGVGPSLDGLPGQARRAGKRLEAFVRESIVDPDAYVEPGYAPGVMPKTYADLPREQVDALLRYLVDAGR